MSNLNDDPITKKINAVRALKAAGYDPRAFVNKQGSTSLSGKRATVAQLMLAPALASRPAVARGGVAAAKVRTSNRPARDAGGDGVIGTGAALMRGVADSLPFNMWDRAVAAGGAGLDAYHGRPLGASYDARFEAEKARDREDERYHPNARTAGKLVGTLGQFALLPGAAVAKGGLRIAEAAPLIGRELAALGGVGAGFGLATQGASDLVHGRLGSVGDYGGSALGGAAGALASLRRSPRDVGFVDGGVTSLAQDLLNGRRLDYEKARQAALEAASFAVPAGSLAEKWAGSRPNTTKAGTVSKEKMGEFGSRVRTVARGDRTATTLKSREYFPDGKYFYPDQRTVSGQLVESKFGPYARLSKGQGRAHSHEDMDFRADHFLSRDGGAAAAFPMGFLGYELGRDEDR
ncbi:MAG: hypothetical protein JF564_00810 [Sphingomonas sp.]|nr:hypothetical protein [Sphingomonas sp.]